MRKNAGFSLIELMIVLAIIAIIATFAVPSYFDQIRKAKRSDALAMLMQIQLKEESWRSDNQSYITGIRVTDGTPNLGVDTSSVTTYVFSIPSANSNTYTISAVAQGEQAKDGGNVDANGNGACATLTINQSNVRTPPSCWFSF